jgi:hypothetical protein
MNNNNNNIDPSSYITLKTKQQMFIRCMYQSLSLHQSLSSTTTSEFSRKDLKQIANDHGIAWAPAWIVKDQKRVTKRGMYSVPELAAYSNVINASPQIEQDLVTIVEDVPAADDMLDVVAECCEDVVDVIKVELTDWAITA